MKRIQWGAQESERQGRTGRQVGGSYMSTNGFLVARGMKGSRLKDRQVEKRNDFHSNEATLP